MRVDYECPGSMFVGVEEDVVQIPRIGETVRFASHEQTTYRVHMIVQFRDIVGTLRSVRVVLR